jgi:HK97 family phage major capsid protein
MTLETMLSDSKGTTIPYADLRALVSDRKVFGTDVVDALRNQQDRRRDDMQTILDKARGESRELHASEQRAFDKATSESDQIGELLRDVERRGDDNYRVPPAVTHNRVMDEDGVALRKDQSVVEWARRKGIAGAGQMSFGRTVRGFLTGNREGLTDLELRALNEGTDSAGGFTVPTPLAAQFIDRMRNASVVFKAGAQTVPMTSETLSIARLAQPGAQNLDSPAQRTPLWKVENANIDESAITLERVQFVARTLPILFRLSVELSEDSNNIDAIIEREMSAAMALEVDRVALLGSGTAPEPRGIKNQSGITTIAFGAAPANYSFLLTAIGDVWAANHTPNYRVYNAKLATALAKLVYLPYSSAPAGLPLIAPREVDEVPLIMSNQIPMDGTSPNGTSAFVGDFTQLMIGMRTGFRMEVSREAHGAFRALQIVVRAYLRADVQVAHPEAFVVTTGVQC